MARSYFSPAIMAVVLCGCTTDYHMGTSHQSNFTYPESSVVALENVRGVATDGGIGYPSFGTGRLQRQALDKALDSAPSGANVLLDYKENVKMTIYPIPFISVYQTEVSVDGLAAKAEVK